MHFLAELLTKTGEVTKRAKMHEQMPLLWLSSWALSIYASSSLSVGSSINFSLSSLSHHAQMCLMSLSRRIHTATMVTLLIYLVEHDVWRHGDCESRSTQQLLNRAK